MGDEILLLSENGRPNCWAMSKKTQEDKSPQALYFDTWIFLRSRKILGFELLNKFGSSQEFVGPYDFEKKIPFRNHSH
jgi:hypothetical protein